MMPIKFPFCGLTASTVFIGRNSRGNWVAREHNGLFGGVFVNRDQAFKYALFKNGRHLEAIVELAHEIHLDIFADPQSAGTTHVLLEEIEQLNSASVHEG
ncbi:hypothetical protein [Bradyrhizobium sp. LCT2]|uniref:hypothetical protein n=1 Tax=Bradyrhizobium sp. LCT2 TaxID=2493093 RepID=UPI001FEE631B|nr:hypothetical protein [Bradyrhizobium sp. LCT2]